jgi:UDP-2,3-diacylglucosamine pyrophosphatase LpxH
MLTRFLDRLNTRWLRLSTKVAAGALAHARHHQAARIFCGHTHAALHRHEDGVDYYNSGSWIDDHPKYITVGEEGVQIHEYIEQPDNVRAGGGRSEADSELAEFEQPFA